MNRRSRKGRAVELPQAPFSDGRSFHDRPAREGCIDASAPVAACRSYSGGCQSTPLRGQPKRRRASLGAALQKPRYMHDHAAGGTPSSVSGSNGPRGARFSDTSAIARGGDFWCATARPDGHRAATPLSLSSAPAFMPLRITMPGRSRHAKAAPRFAWRRTPKGCVALTQRRGRGQRPRLQRHLQRARDGAPGSRDR